MPIHSAQAPPWKRPIQILLLTALVAGFTSCATHPPETKTVAAGASISAIPPRGHQTHIKGLSLKAVNNRPVQGKAASLSTGSNEVTARLPWPNARAQTLKLRFKARGKQSYFIKCVTHPTRDYSREVTASYSGSRTAQNLITAGASLSYFGIPLVAGGAAVGMVEGLGRTTQASLAEAVGSASRGNFVDVLVVSENPAEGVVCRVRAFPDGRME